MSYENIPKDTLGRVITQPNDYFISVSGGGMPGALDDRMVGRSLNVSNGTYETLWDQGGNYTYLTADTQLYASSTSAADTAVVLLIQGLGADYAEKSVTVTMNGQTQVALSGLMFRISAVLVTSATTPAGRVYIAESDTLTAGTPNTATKIQSTILLSPGDVGDFASFNITHNGFFTVPAGKELHVLSLFNSVSRADDIQLDLRARLPGGAWLSLNMVWAYESPSPLPYMQRPTIGEKSDMQVRIRAGGPNQVCEANMQFVLVDKV
tara:strand:- start:23446 stop:24243 length:798 start_codon:yes stop_codon:yes gene_type:complete